MSEKPRDETPEDLKRYVQENLPFLEQMDSDPGLRSLKRPDEHRAFAGDVEDEDEHCVYTFGDHQCGIDLAQLDDPHADCDKRYDTCCNVYGNAKNFGGTPPNVPKTPEAPPERLQLAYRCRRCGEGERGQIGGRETVERVLVQVAAEGASQKNFGYPVCLHDVHVCRDGCLGITDLVGAVIPVEVLKQGRNSDDT